MKAVVLASGGLDSTVLACEMQFRGFRPHLLGVNYGQRHERELESLRAVAIRLAAPLEIVDLCGLAQLWRGSSQTDPSVAVPHGHYAAENMRVTVVPNRNATLLSIAWGHAVSIGAQLVATAVHAGDHFVYPDCRPEFTAAIERALRLGNAGFGDHTLSLATPFLTYTKAEIVKRGAELAAPMDLTWSCYDPQLPMATQDVRDYVHCGRCGTCVERREAFELAKVADPTAYAG